MSYQEVDIEKLRIINGECLIEIHSLVENEIDFNGTKLEIVTKVKGSHDFAHENDVMDLVKRMKKFHYKDQEAMKWWYNNDNDPFDDNGHGTHTAGTIGATGFNGTGVIGVSPNVQIMALKFLGASGTGSAAAGRACFQSASSLN